MRFNIDRNRTISTSRPPACVFTISIYPKSEKATKKRNPVDVTSSTTFDSISEPDQSRLAKQSNGLSIDSKGPHEGISELSSKRRNRTMIRKTDEIAMIRIIGMRGWLMCCFGGDAEYDIVIHLE